MTAAICFMFVVSLIPAASFAASSSFSIKGTVSAGSDPIWSVYDSSNGLVIVTDSASNELTLLSSGSTPAVVSTIPTASGPWGAAPTGAACNNDIAVANSGSGSISLFSASAPHKLVATITIPSVVPTSKVSVPRDIAYASGNLYVADGAGQIDIISCSTHKLLESVALTPFSSLAGAFYDSKHRIVYFGDQGASSIEYFDLTGNEPGCLPPTPCFITSVGGNLTDSPSFFAEDNNGIVYFTDSVANTIREISIVNDTPVIDATQFGNFYSHEFNAPTGITYDSQTRELLVANTAGSHEITVLCINNYSVFCKSAGVGGFEQISNGGNRGFGIVYDPMNGYIYVTNQNSASVSYLS